MTAALAPARALTELLARPGARCRAMSRCRDITARQPRGHRRRAPSSPVAAARITASSSRSAPRRPARARFCGSRRRTSTPPPLDAVDRGLPGAAAARAPGPDRRSLLRCPLGAPHGDRHHRHQRQDHLCVAARAGARATAATARPIWAPSAPGFPARYGRSLTPRPMPSRCIGSSRRFVRKASTALRWRFPRTRSIRSAARALRLHAAVFTNLTRDHLDYHADMARLRRPRRRSCSRGRRSRRGCSISMMPSARELARRWSRDRGGATLPDRARGARTARASAARTIVCASARERDPERACQLELESSRGQRAAAERAARRLQCRQSAERARQCCSRSRCRSSAPARRWRAARRRRDACSPRAAARCRWC